MTRANVRCLGLLACTIAALASPGAPAAQDDGDDAAALRAMVREDWALQERRLGREAGSPRSIREALRRARLLIDNLRRVQGVGDLAGLSAELRELAARADDGLDALDPAARLEL